jgi:hypothetical protein
MGDEKMFSLKEMSYGMDQLIALLPLDADGKKLGVVMKGFVMDMLMTDEVQHQVNSATEAEKFKDTLREYYDFKKFTQQKEMKSTGELAILGTSASTITGIGSMDTATGVNNMSKLRSKCTKSAPPAMFFHRKNEPSSLEDAHKHIFEKCAEEQPREPDEFRKVTELEVAAIEVICKTFDFKESEAPKIINYVEAKYARIYFCSSELAQRAVTGESEMYSTTDCSLTNAERELAALNLAGRVLKASAYLGNKRSSELSVLKKLVNCGFKELEEATFKQNKLTYFRYPSVCTPDLIGMLPGSNKIIVVEVKEHFKDGKAAKLSSAARQLANMMYVMNVNHGYVALWGNYDDYRSVEDTSVSMRFPRGCPEHQIYAEFFPESKTRSSGKRFDQDLFKKRIVFVQSGSGLIRVQKYEYRDALAKKVAKFHSRGLSELRAALKTIGYHGFKALKEKFGSISQGIVSDTLVCREEPYDVKGSRIYGKFDGESGIDLGTTIVGLRVFEAAIEANLLNFDGQAELLMLNTSLKAHLRALLDNPTIRSKDLMRVIAKKVAKIAGLKETNMTKEDSDSSESQPHAKEQVDNDDAKAKLGEIEDEIKAFCYENQVYLEDFDDTKKVCEEMAQEDLPVDEDMNTNEIIDAEKRGLNTHMVSPVRYQYADSGKKKVYAVRNTISTRLRSRDLRDTSTHMNSKDASDSSEDTPPDPWMKNRAQAMPQRVQADNVELVNTANANSEAA